MVGPVGLLAVEPSDQDDVCRARRGVGVDAHLEVAELGNPVLHTLQRRHGRWDVVWIFEGEHHQVRVHGAG